MDHKNVGSTHALEPTFLCVNIIILYLFWHGECAM